MVHEKLRGTIGIFEVVKGFIDSFHPPFSMNIKHE